MGTNIRIFFFAANIRIRFPNSNLLNSFKTKSIFLLRNSIMTVCKSSLD